MGILGRYWRTVRHLKREQVYWRFRYGLLRRLGVRPRPRVPSDAPELDADFLERLRGLWRLRAEHAPSNAEVFGALREGRLVFLGEAPVALDALSWDGVGHSMLWRYKLHGFDFLPDWLAANADGPLDSDGALVLAVMRDWVKKNPPGTKVAWDAFPIASRLLHWAVAFSVFGFDDAELRTSYAMQAAYLAKSLEYDVRANHLLKNAAALVVAGTLLGNGLRAKGLALLEEEVREQVLPDGGHYERSPMYHGHVMQDCLLAGAALGGPPEFLRDTVGRMSDFLESILHPDGEIPLFGDSVLADPLPARGLVAWARAVCDWEPEARTESNYSLPDSGFHILRSPQDKGHAIVKAGPPGPSYQLGHAHCDMLSYELSIDGLRFVVDSGVHGYADSPHRAYCRSTRAHNTLSVNGAEQMECWSAFRVGRRHASQVLMQAKVEEVPLPLVTRFDGFTPYRQLRGIGFDIDGLTVCDTISGPGVLSVESYIHFHPEVSVSGEAPTWLLERQGTRAQLSLLQAPSEPTISCETAEPSQAYDFTKLAPPVEARLEEGLYCPAFGKAVTAPMLILRGKGTSPFSICYSLEREPFRSKENDWSDFLRQAQRLKRE